ncbi:MAG: hypothetical protein PHR92_15380 [Lachnospiraceae bacterium]|nr:hypothetical protein [Lachnospiraceae bacterium]
MIAVLCIMAIFLALAFSILLTASVAYSSSQSSMAAEKCKIMAVSLSDALSSSLTERGQNENALQKYVHDAMKDRSWSYYREDEAFHNDKASVSREYEVSTDSTGTVLPSGYTVRITMYWSPEEETIINYNKDDSFKGSILYVTAVCSMGGGTYQARSSYSLSVSEQEDSMQWIWDAEGRE